MENLKILILSICGSTAIVSLCKIILSNSKIKKTTNVFFSLFVLFYSIIPLFNSDVVYKNINVFSDEIEFDEKYYVSGYISVIEKSINSVCADNSIEVISIDINAYNEDNYIVIEDITITIKDKNKIYDTELLIKNELGFEVIVNWNI